MSARQRLALRCAIYIRSTRSGTCWPVSSAFRTIAAQPFEPASAIFPGHVAPVVGQSADGEREIALMSWGFVLLQNSRAPRRVTNVRDDKILERKFWRGSFEERRCPAFVTASWRKKAY
ncbi:MAG TPA: SOS response-associated peptidase family protein [Hyphomicrobiaceae bacterium]|nr:SOS response-associated peptidase family protein [Hyphomicrobiaceae bacterium]